MSSESTVARFRDPRSTRLCLNIAPQPKFVRAREPVRPSAGKVVGFFPSVKNNRQIAWESQLEKRACFLFEFSSVVQSYKEQPVTISYPYTDQSLMCKYTPDFELILTNGDSIYVEVKPASKLANIELINRLCHISEHFKSNQHHFLVLTDEELNQPIRQRNLAFLRPHLLPKCKQQLVEQAKSWLDKQNNSVLEGLIAFIGMNEAYSLIAQGYISIDLDKTISKSTPITFQLENDDETSLFTYRTAPYFERRAIHDSPHS